LHSRQWDIGTGSIGSSNERGEQPLPLWLSDESELC